MIRLARPADRATLREIQTYLREPNPALLAYAIDGPPVVLVSATPDGDLAGYLVALHDGETSYVAEIAVAPAYRREGRARRLLAGAFDLLRERDCATIRLSVRPDNDAARRLYESMGFEEVGREEGYYDDGSAAITMQRDL
ncbi:GNAT family N-acetyltransferase [Halorussus gelatinilyticus]|uniref:GNAT family N-acetyltransferase n=1 Tax=Halorussus gelatinilyticus TaxID=2937524 RepID=A0A8U0ILH9_9EURY|nr:GNAT family N-acetyltransferase [Halorussus gelatinilyticus]UPW00899.1 GNAT family N-acetyltransferase [Halorussus gelatinilyticus]